MSDSAAPAPAAPKTAVEMIVGYFKDFGVLAETRKEYWGIQIVNFLDCTVYFALLNIASVFLSEDLGMSDEHAGYALAIFTSATTILLLFSGAITDWLGIRKSTYVAMGAQGLLRLGLVLLGLVPAIPHRGIVAAVILFLMAPFMAMIQTVFQSANTRYTSKRSRSAGFSLWYMFMNIGAAAGGFLIDIIRKLLDLPNAHVFTVGAVFAILCSVVTAAMVRNENQLAIGSESEPAPPPAPAERKNPIQNFVATYSNPVAWRLLALIALMLGVRAIFAYLFLLFPKYWLRTIGPDAAIGSLQAINPILIFLGIILFIPLVNRFNLFSMLVYGSLVSAASLLLLVLPWQWFSGDIAAAHYRMSFAFMLVLSIGEIIWSPKLYEYTAAIAPAGQEGTYLGLSMVPWFFAKTAAGAVSGHLLTRWCPEGIGARMAAGEVGFWDSPAAMWLVLAVYAIVGCLISLGLRSWFTKDMRSETPVPAAAH